MTEDKQFPEQGHSAKIHGTDDAVPKMKADVDATQEGHVKEWEDRARVVLDAKEAVQEPASPNQSPVRGGDEDVEEKSDRINRGTENY